MITTDSILAAVNRRRVALAALRGSVEPVPFTQVAEDIGVHSSLFSRLKSGVMPSEMNIGKIASWVGSEEALLCEECTDLAKEDEVEELSEEASSALEEELEDILETDEELDAEEQTVKAVFAVGKLSESKDPETQSAVARVRELLSEGAVGVSVSLDTHPDDMEILLESEKKWMESEGEKPLEDFLPEGFVVRQRIRHTAIVDTPAFADARLDIQEDGTLSGFVVFESEYTGDGRRIELNSIDIESSRTPSPIIWDRHDGDHTGMTVGFLESFERQDAPPSSSRPVLNDEAITASLKPMTFPSAYFAQTVPTKASPIVIGAPDKKGYRAISGLAAPRGVCHRSSMTCFTLPNDLDASHRHYHTGALIGLDDGNDIRVGALTFGGAHLDPALAQSGITASRVGNHRDDANKVFALVRAFNTRFGLWINGVVPPGVSEADITRALACSPSVEIWPEGGKRHLVGIHMVPTPAWPVMASMGAAEIAVGTDPIELADDALGEFEEEDEPIETPPESDGSAEGMEALRAEIDSMQAKLDSIAETAAAILALIPIDDVEIPDE